MIFFNIDGTITLSVTVFSELTSKYESALIRYFNSSLVLIYNEILPPDNREEFMKSIT
jgi:hypothetical protein